MDDDDDYYDDNNNNNNNNNNNSLFNSYQWLYRYKQINKNTAVKYFIQFINSCHLRYKTLLKVEEDTYAFKSFLSAPSIKHPYSVCAPACI
jgi:hypothetical protein